MVFHFEGLSKTKWQKDILQVLFENNYEKVFKTAYSITLDIELSKDATQEAFLRALINIDSLKDKSKFTAWICTIAVNISKDIVPNHFKSECIGQ